MSPFGDQKVDGNPRRRIVEDQYVEIVIRRHWLTVVGPWLLGLALVGMNLGLAILGEARAEEKAGMELEAGLAAMAEASKSEPDKTANQLEGAGSYVAPATVKGASMAVWRGEARISRDTPRLGLDLGWTTDRYDFTRAGRLPFGGEKPFEALNLLDGGVTSKGPLWRDMNYFAGLRGSLGFERDPGDGFGVSAMAGVALPLGTDWAVTVGGGLSWNRIRTQPFPVVGLHYESPAIRGLSADLGFPRTEIAWRANAYWGLRLTGSLEENLYKLADDNAAAAGGYVEMLSSRVGLWLDLRPMTGLSVSLGGLYAPAGQMTLYRESGSRLKTYDIGGAPGGAARLRYEF
jgi:hypothetical protein